MKFFWFGTPPHWKFQLNFGFWDPTFPLENPITFHGGGINIFWNHTLLSYGTGTKIFSILFKTFAALGVIVLLHVSYSLHYSRVQVVFLEVLGAFFLWKKKKNKTTGANINNLILQVHMICNALLMDLSYKYHNTGTLQYVALAWVGGAYTM